MAVARLWMFIGWCLRGMPSPVELTGPFSPGVDVVLVLLQQRQQCADQLGVVQLAKGAIGRGVDNVQHAKQCDERV